MLYQFLSVLNKVMPAKPVYAHCDIPCGIYKAEPMKTAAETVVKMAELITNPPLVFDTNSPDSVRNYHNAMTRYVLVKEEHAQECKKQVLILWTDFFKPEHLELFPDLHEKVWNITKLCSQNKQKVSVELAKELQKEVQEFAEIFEKAKAVK